MQFEQSSRTISWRFYICMYADSVDNVKMQKYNSIAVPHTINTFSGHGFTKYNKIVNHSHLGRKSSQGASHITVWSCQCQFKSQTICVIIAHTHFFAVHTPLRFSSEPFMQYADLC